MNNDPLTTDMIVMIDMFEDDVAHTAGLLRAAAADANAAGDADRGRALRVAAREVARDYRDVEFVEIDAKTEELRRLREAMLG